MQSTSLRRYLILGVSSSVLGACSGQEPQRDLPELGNYLGTPVAPAAAAAPKLGVCPDGFSSVGTSSVPSCQPSARPEPPRLAASCPAGWEFLQQNVDALGTGIPVPVCRPKVPSTRCADGHRVDLTTNTCVPVGQACPSTAWPQDLPIGSTTVYVRAGASGSGTADSPYGSFAQALQSTPDGGVLVVGPGTYPANARIEKQVTIVGVCAQQVTIEGPESTMIEVANDPLTLEGTFDVRAPGSLRLRNVTVRGRRVGVHLLSGASATVQGVRFDQNTYKAIVVDGGSLELSDAVVERTLPLPDGREGRGLQVSHGGRATVQNVTFQDNDRSEVAAHHSGSDVKLFDVVLQNTRVGGESDGEGILAAERARVEANRVFVRAKRTAAIYGIAGAEISLDHAYVAQTQPDSGGWGIGLRLEAASAHVTSAVFMSSTLGAIYATGDTVLTGSDITVANTLGHPVDQTFGRGIAAWDGSKVALDRVFVADSNETGVYVSGAEAAISDLTLKNNGSAGLIAERNAEVSITRATSFNDELSGVLARSAARVDLVDMAIDDVLQVQGRGNDAGWGIFNSAASIRLERVAVRRTHQFGVASVRGNAKLNGVVVEDTLGDPVDSEQGYGVLVQGGETTVQGLIVRRAEGVGFVAGTSIDEDDESPEPVPPTRLEASDVIVDDTRPDPVTRELGWGAAFFAGLEATLTRLAITSSYTVGLSLNFDNEVSIADLTVRGTRPHAATGYHGLGLSVQNGSRLELDRALVAGSSSLGVLLSGALASIQATDLTVLDTQAAKGLNGGAIGVFSGAGLQITRGKIAGHRATGIQVQFGGALKASDITISDIKSGTFPNEDIFGADNIDGAGDCILALSRATVELTSASLSGCARVGLLFDDASGTLTDVKVKDAPLGIALQGFPQPEVSWSSVGVQGSATPLMSGSGTLAVPATPPPILSVGSEVGTLVRTQ